mmetsp:Transcript_33065/g.28978  ORF Transcript_33065/g.28978 Transcript_33065/m.28978 type:complete len:272 (+) Transcript_33065:68-883(+)
MSTYYLLALIALIFVVINDKVNAQTDGPVLVVIGDSWGAYGWHDLQKVLTAKGSNLTVVSYAIGGTTAKFWARTPDLVNELVNENPTAEYVWLSIGGNDVIDFMPGCTEKMSVQDCINIILPETLNNTQAFLDPLVADHPDLEIVQFGYDIPNLGENVLCRQIGEQIIDGCNDTASCINPQFVKIQYLYVDELAKMYKQLTSVNLLGSLQAQDHYAGVTITNPDLTKWSPADLMETNCIHPTRVGRGNEPAGFDVIFDNLWDAYFAKRISV